ncbi:MAG: hypothetical protein WCA09_04175 [Burkholderiales bacterium]
MNKLILTAVATAFTANVAIAASVTEANGLLADGSGRTLYTFDKDASNKSNCTGGCAVAWPPFMVKEGDRAPATFNVITRDDGAKQWAMNGKPLYFFAGDGQSGDATGDGRGGVWHVIRGEGKRTEAKPAAASRAAQPWSYSSPY